MFTINELTEKINHHFAELQFTRQPQGLYDPISYVLSLGGKRIRPVLMQMAYNLYREDVERILPQATGIEVYHNYTLLHDDLMDKADRRRGKPTVHKVWDENTAILSGDAMLVLAYQFMAQCPPEKLKEVMDLFSLTALEICEGQQLDMDFEKRKDVTEAEYIEMIRLKTSVLLSCSLKMGAILAEASPEDANHLYDFGIQLGLAFQLKDDLLDVYGNPEVFGKNIGGDILCNKKTYMLINAYNRAGDDMRGELTRWVTAEEFDPAEKIAAVTAIYDKVGIKELAEQKINYYFDQSRKYLAAVNVPDERKAVLAGYTDKMMKRKS